MPFNMITRALSCREAFPDTLRILSNIVEHMHRGGAASEWDLNNVLLRFAMDMTSIVVSASITAKQSADSVMQTLAFALWGAVPSVPC